MKSKIFLSLFFLYLNISICYSHAVLYINTKSNDSYNQNDPQNEVNIFSIHNEDKEGGIKNVLKFRDDYTLYPSFGYYKYHIHGALWLNAKYICELEGAHLAVINSQAEADLISGIIKTYPKALVQYHDYIMMGFHDMYKEGEFVTVLGGLLNDTGFTKWGVGEPNNLEGNQNCGCINVKGTLDDCTCSIPYSFMCEKEL